MVSTKAGDADPVLTELIAIKRLLVFGLMKDGATQGDIAGALGVDQSQVSRMFAKAGSSWSRSKRK